jgi:hypothetical protein
MSFPDGGEAMGKRGHGPRRRAEKYSGSIDRSKEEINTPRRGRAREVQGVMEAGKGRQTASFRGRAWVISCLVTGRT